MELMKLELQGPKRSVSVKHLLLVLHAYTSSVSRKTPILHNSVCASTYEYTSSVSVQAPMSESLLAFLPR